MSAQTATVTKNTLIVRVSKNKKNVHIEKNGITRQFVDCVNAITYIPRTKTLNIDFVDTIMQTITIPGGIFTSDKRHVNIFKRNETLRYDARYGLVIHFNGQIYNNYDDFVNASKYALFE